MTCFLRIEESGAAYHIWNRIYDVEKGFQSDGGAQLLEECFFESLERSGWKLYAYSLKNGEFHAAIKTPEPTLSEGMRYFQGIFGNRFNKLRKGRGPVFESRYQCAIIEPGPFLAQLCHYIHLLPAPRSTPEVMRAYRWSSLWYLWEWKRRPAVLDASVFLSDAAATDSPAGRAKYGRFLEGLSKSPKRCRELGFSRMDNEWAIGSAEFRMDLVRRHRGRLERLVDGSGQPPEFREMILEDDVLDCLRRLGKDENAIQQDAKSADWKAAIAAFVKRRSGVRNEAIARRLNMGAPAGVSRLVGLARKQGSVANDLFIQLQAVDK
jgi:putative transposase